MPLNLELFNSCFDIYGIGFNLRYHKDEKYRTFCGALLGLISMILILTIFLINLINLISHSKFTIIESNDYETVSKINLTSVPFLFALGDRYSQPFGYNVSLFNFSLRLNTYDTVIGNQISYNSTEIHLEKCDINKHFKGYENLFENISVEYYQCIVPGQEINLFSRVGDTRYGFKNLNFYVKQCDKTNTKGIECIPEEDFISAVTNSFINFIYVNKIIDQYAAKKPIRNILRSEYFPVTPSYLKRYYYFFRESFFVNDIGILFSKRETTKFYEYESYTADIDQAKSNPNFEKEVVAYISFTCGDHISRYERTFIKLSDILASVGGISNFVFVAGGLIVKIFSTRMVFSHIANDIMLKNSFSKDLPRKNNINDSLAKQTTLIHVNSSKNYKLKIKKEKIKFNIPKDKTIKFRLTLKQALLPKKWLRKDLIMKQFFYYEKIILKYLSLDYTLPIVEKAEIMANKFLASTGICFFHDNSHMHEEYLQNNNCSNSSIPSIIHS